MPASMISAETGSPIWKVIGKQHGDGRGRADAGQHADQRAEQHADQAEAEMFQRRRGGGEAQGEIVVEFHRAVSSTLAEPGTEKPERQAEPVD